ncbi:uncharacterized protein [Castor canadensis]|uniref:Uncharacterized protein n=1 Tax=Castor canadensis TaxID=51338 RepID=A0AC58K7H2_CASCN
MAAPHPQALLPAREGGEAKRGAQRPHTPARDWPTPQSFSADTSGQPLPSSSRPLLPALGKKSGQRGAGTKDTAAHGDLGSGGTFLQVQGTYADSSQLSSRTPGGHREKRPDMILITHPGPSLEKALSSLRALSEVAGAHPRSPTRPGNHGSARGAGPRGAGCSSQGRQRKPGASSPETRPPLPTSHHTSRPPAPNSVHPARITWFISEEMEKFISGASTGCRRKRAGTGPAESPRGGGEGTAMEREDRRPVRGGCSATEGSEELTSSFAGTAAPKQQAEKLRPAARSKRASGRERPTDLHTRSGDTAAAAVARSRRTPSHVTTCAAATANASRPASGSSASANHRRAPERSRSRLRPRPRPRPPASLAGARSFAAQLGQRKVIRERGVSAAAPSRIAWSFLLPRPAPSLRPPFRTVPELVPIRRLHLFCLPQEAQ